MDWYRWYIRAERPARPRLELAATVQAQRDKRRHHPKLIEMFLEAVTRHPRSDSGPSSNLHAPHATSPTTFVFREDRAANPSTYQRYLENRIRETFGFD